MRLNLALKALLAISVAIAKAEPLRSRGNTITSCLSSSNIPQALPGSSTFDFESKPFNLRLPYTPVAVALPSTIPQVQAAVRCGIRHGLKVSAKAGGHSYASHGLGGENGHLMISLKLFNSVQVDNITKIATIGPGARLGNIAIALYEQGKRAISHGVCPGVGIGGHVLGGGFGYSSHTRGLTLDWLVEAKVVLSSGIVVTASRTQNSELFWALKGAGSSFGIIVSLKFNTFPAPDATVAFAYTYNGLTQAQSSLAIKTLQDYASSTNFPRELNLRMFIPAPQYNMTVFMGAYYGTEAGFQSAIQPVINALGPPSDILQGVVGWLESLTSLGQENLPTPLEYDAHDTFFSKSLMTTRVSNSAIDKFTDYWFTSGATAPRPWYINLDLHGGPTSYTSSVTGEAGGAYPHRNAVLKWQFMDISPVPGSYPADGFSFLDGFVKTLTSTTPERDWGMYLNYPDPTLPQDKYARYYWKENYPRLRLIKTIYDPTDVFHNPQAVLPF